MRMNLKAIRVSYKLTQKQVAEKLSISLRFYQHIEGGTRKGKIELWDKLEDIFSTPQRILRTDTSV